MTDQNETNNTNEPRQALSNTTGSAPWGGSESEIDSEVHYLVHLVEEGWAWQWPGWKWVARSLNYWHKKDRSAEACRKKYGRVYAARSLPQNAELSDQ